VLVNQAENVRERERVWVSGRECGYQAENVRERERVWESGRECECEGESASIGLRM
jgi:hypothetical protein